MLLSLLSLVALAAEPTPAAVVVVPPAVLLDKAAPAEPVAPVAYTVDARALWVEPIEGAVRVRARVDLRSLPRVGGPAADRGAARDLAKP